jgi:hypothetical protein
LPLVPVEVMGRNVGTGVGVDGNCWITVVLPALSAIRVVVVGDRVAWPGPGALLAG